MPRRRSFDEHAVLTGAMHAFRRAGHAGASVRDLEAATGLSAGSLYNAYGDKDGLFRAAFAHYVDTIIRKRLAGCSGPQARLEDIEEFFLSLLRPPLADGHGCLLTNSIMEFGAAPSIASAFIDQGIALLRKALTTVLKREVGARNAHMAVTHLLLIYQGILVLCRGGRTDPATATAIRQVFDGLRQQRQHGNR